MKRKLTPVEIERLKAAGTEKREERRKAREEREKEALLKKAYVLPEGLEQRLKDLESSFERSFHLSRFTQDQWKEAEDLLFLNADRELRVRAYLAHTYLYERIVFCMWQDRNEASKAFAFFDDVLSDERTVFTGNSVLNMLSGRVDENLLKLFQNHRQKFQSSYLASVLKTIVSRNLNRYGPYNCKMEAYRKWTDDEIRIFKEVYEDRKSVV